MSKNKKTKPDIVNKKDGQSWAYSEVVRDHFFHPRNLLFGDPAQEDFNTEGMVGSPACGDVMRIWLLVDPKTEKIKKFKWRTFGCASAIASTSMLSVMTTEDGGMTVDKALAITAGDVTARLGGLPERKEHCSVLGDKALRVAINNWFKSQEQYDRIVTSGERVLDPHTRTTEADIEEAVIDGLTTLEKIQERTKVGLGYPECLPEVEQLIRFYCEKYGRLVK